MYDTYMMWLQKNNHWVGEKLQPFYDLTMIELWLKLIDCMLYVY